MPRYLLLILLVLFSFISCQKKQQSNTINGTKNKTTNATIAKKYATVGDSFYTEKKFDSAYYHYNQAKEIFENERDTLYAAYTLIQMARIQQISGDYSSSEETLTEALPFIENDLSYQIASNNLFGIAAKEMKNYDDAIYYYTKIYNSTKDVIVQLTPLNNIAAVYIEQKKFKDAIAILEPLSQKKFLDTLPQKKAVIIDNLGFAYARNGDREEGLQLMNESLLIRKKLLDSYGSIESYLHLAEFYKSINYNKSKEYALQALTIARFYKSIDEQLEALSFLMIYSENKEKNNYASQFLFMNDSIKKEQNNAKNQFAKIKYDSRKIELENIKFKAERVASLLQIERQNNHIYLFILSSALLVLSSLYIANYYRRKHKKERLAASYATETRISKALHDELANDVFYAMNFAETQDLQNAIKKESLLSHLDKIYQRTRNFSRENSPIETGIHFESELKQMLSSYKSSCTEVIIRNGNPIDWSNVSTEKKIATQRVLQELMVNMKKHSQAGFVVIGFEKEQNLIKIDYSDNGIGLTKKIILKNGLQNAENRIRGVKGILTFESETDKGFRAKIVLPK